MSTVKISQLATITQLDANTSNSLFMGVDIPSGVTGKFTAHTLAQGLYSNEVLNVGSNPVVFPNVAAQFSGNGSSYLQVNLQNFDGNGSGDIVITADNGTNDVNFIDMGINGSTYDVGVYSALKANDGYLVVVGNEGSPGGNLTLGTASTNTRINFINSGLEIDNVVGYIDHTGAHFANIDTEISANLVTAKAYTDTANVFLSGVNASQNNRIDAAFVTANTSLANTSGTIFGGNLTVAGMLTINNSSFGANTSALAITGSNGFARQTPSSDGYMLHITGKDAIPAKVILDSFGANTYSVFAGKSARGTAAAPSATQLGDVIARFSASGYGTTGFQPLGVGRIDFIATENHTDSSRGTQIQLWNCPNGSNTLTNIATFNGNDVFLTGTVHAANVIANGTISFVNVNATGNINSNNAVLSGTFRYDSSVNNATVTQLTDKTTTVTCNGRTGQITTAASSVAKGAAVTFTVNNSFITAVTDVVVVTAQTGATVNSYAFSVTRTQVGSFNITITNNGTGPLTDTIVLNFAVIKVA